MPTLAELNRQVDDVRSGWLKIYQDAPKKKDADGSEQPDLNGAQLKTLLDMNEDLNRITAERDIMAKAEEVATKGWVLKEDPTADFSRKAYDFQFDRKSPTRRIMDELTLNGKFVLREKHQEKTLDLDPFEFKTTMTTAAGYTPEVLRDGDMVLSATRPPQILDLIPSYTTTQNGLAWMAETTYTPASAGTSEGSALAEATFAYAPTTGIITRIGSQVPITEDELEDIVELQMLIEGRLRFGANVELDRQIIVGNGTPPTLRGLYNATGVQSAAYDGVTAGLETTLNTLATAMRLVEVNGYGVPGFVVLHNTDKWKVATVRDSQGRYIFGDPANSPTARVWGVPLVRCDAMTVGTALVGDPSFAALARRKEMTFEIGWINDQFTKNVKTLKLSGRYGLKIRRGAAFCRATSLP